MSASWVFYGILFAATFLLTWLARWFAIRQAIIDVPNVRSSHTKPTPRGGGVAVAFVWFAAITWMDYHDMMNKDLYHALMAGGPLCLIGFLDDIQSLRPFIRILIHCLTAGMGVVLIGGFHQLDLGFGVISLNILRPMAILAIVWGINLFNFLDGIDGYLSSEVLFLGAVIAFFAGDSLGFVLVAIMLGFLIWNWQPAKIFMGDVGSTLLGYTIVLLALFQINTYQINIYQWLILTSVFWFDATVTLFRRIQNNEKLQEAHKQHAFQRIVQAGFSHQKTTLLMLVLNIVQLALVIPAGKYPRWGAVFFLVSVALLSAVMYAIDRKKPFDYYNLTELTKS